MKRLILLFVVSLFAASSAVADGSAFGGQWRINLPESDKVAVRYEDGSGIKSPGLGGFKPTISVMGLPMPQSIRQGAMSSLAAKDPQVLRCTNMSIDLSKKNVLLNYDNSESEKLVKGDYRGRKSSWSRKKIEQNYKTTERKVKKTWTLREDGRLLVTVRIKPRDDKARVYKRVFDRVTPTAPGQQDSSS